jgi:hypothetical protein
MQPKQYLKRLPEMVVFMRRSRRSFSLVMDKVTVETIHGMLKPITNPKPSLVRMKKPVFIHEKSGYEIFIQAAKGYGFIGLMKAFP